MAKSKAGSTHILVAAIDFGTTYSGWAYSFLHEYKANPTQIAAKNWTGGQLVSSKGPTCILIKPDGKTFDSFGYAAESKYGDLAGEEKHKQWYFFRRFKMLLYGRIGIERNIELEEENKKKSLPAKTVFSLSIRFLKDDLLATAGKRLLDSNITPEEIYWVLTVPAIWNDAAKDFMREAAEEAGISKTNLTIALEPEAASLYCRYLQVDKNLGDKGFSFASLKAGQKYVILDAGGGTVDITVHEVQTSGGLKELHRASGGPWGGTKVDDAFLRLMEEIFGNDVMKIMKSDCVEDYFDMFRDFEIKKREISSTSGKINMRLPAILSEMVKDMTGKTVAEKIAASSYASKMSTKPGRLNFDGDLFRGFFKKAVDSIIEHLKMLFQAPQVRGCSTILMVGGFSESSLLQEMVRQNFQAVRSIIPQEAGLAVLKGAVIFGHCPDAIQYRVSRFTYGVGMSFPFIEGEHLESNKKIEDTGEIWCDNIFETFVRAGDCLKVGEIRETNAKSASDKTSTQKIRFYATEKENPKYTNEDGCSEIGSCVVQMPVTSKGRSRDIEVRMIFGGTELLCESENVDTGEVEHLALNFLG